MSKDYSGPFGGFSEIPSNGLVWKESEGIGFYPVKEAPYDQAYFDRYKQMAKTQVGKRLLNFRLDLVDDYLMDDTLIDIGIGSGVFVETRGYHTYGYDVNVVAQQWLDARKLWFDPYAMAPESISCWDSLEHILCPQLLIERVQKYIFISIPIFENREHVERSKHFRKDEHYWYFTKRGLTAAMAYYDFRLLFDTNEESQIGREDIHTFVFKRHE